MRAIGNAEIDDDELLWRYVTAARFVEFIEGSRLYFAAATQFTDPFEGAVAVMPPGIPVDPRYDQMDGPERASTD